MLVVAVQISIISDVEKNRYPYKLTSRKMVTMVSMII